MAAPRLDPRTRHRVGRACERSLAKVLEALGPEAGGRTGGKFRAFYAVSPAEGPKGWLRLCEGKIGTQQREEDWQKYEHISYEKFTRLAKDNARYGHVSAWQSRNTEMWEYGGAFILLVDLPNGDGQLMEVEILVTFSGLPELGDEAFLVLVLKDLGWGSQEQYEDLLGVSRNDFALKLLKAA